MAELSLLCALGIAGTGVLMGAINNLAGGGGALGIVAFEELAGMGAKPADINLRPAGLAIGLAGALGFASRGRKIPAHAWLLGLVAIPGALLGSWLVIELPAFVLQVVLASILVVVLWQQLSPRRDAPRARDPSPWLSVAWFTLMGAHLGFVQVGAGLLTMIALTHLGQRDLVEINAIKVAVVILTAAASVGFFAWKGQLDWGPALCLMGGAAVGSVLASRWSVDKGHGAVRVVVIAITVGVLARLCWQIAFRG